MSWDVAIEGAEPLALAVLASDAPSELKESAVHALGHVVSDAAIDALFAALGGSALASFALARCAHPSITARASARAGAHEAASNSEPMTPAPR